MQHLSTIVDGAKCDLHTVLFEAHLCSCSKLAISGILTIGVGHKNLFEMAPILTNRITMVSPQNCCTHVENHVCHFSQSSSHKINGASVHCVKASSNTNLM